VVSDGDYYEAEIIFYDPVQYKKEKEERRRRRKIAR